jgi:phosphatidylethanolamine-binding protein (PEBP) family uncharacterized protein
MKLKDFILEGFGSGIFCKISGACPPRETHYYQNCVNGSTQTVKEDSQGHRRMRFIRMMTRIKGITEKMWAGHTAPFFVHEKVKPSP